MMGGRACPSLPALVFEDFLGTKMDDSDQKEGPSLLLRESRKERSATSHMHATTYLQSRLRLSGLILQILGEGDACAAREVRRVRTQSLSTTLTTFTIIVPTTLTFNFLFRLVISSLASFSLLLSSPRVVLRSSQTNLCEGRAAEMVRGRRHHQPKDLAHDNSGITTTTTTTTHIFPTPLYTLSPLASLNPLSSFLVSPINLLSRSLEATICRVLLIARAEVMAWVSSSWRTLRSDSSLTAVMVGSLFQVVFVSQQSIEVRGEA